MVWRERPSCTPIKASRFGKRYGYEAFGRWCAASKEQIKERKLGDMTKATAMAALRRTKDRAEFIALLRAKGVDVVLRETDTGRIYGATFIDHRTGCVLNGSRMGKELSANALQEHFEPPLSPSIARRMISYFSAQANRPALQPQQTQDSLMPNVQLTEREREVLLRVAKGFTLPEIGVQLGLSRHTIADYVKQIYRKLNVSSRAEAALEAQRLGLFRR